MFGLKLPCERKGEIQIKNKTCYYFRDIININNLNLDKIFVADVKDSTYNISYKDLYRYL